MQILAMRRNDSKQLLFKFFCTVNTLERRLRWKLRTTGFIKIHSFSTKNRCLQCIFCPSTQFVQVVNTEFANSWYYTLALRYDQKQIFAMLSAQSKHPTVDILRIYKKKSSRFTVFLSKLFFCKVCLLSWYAICPTCFTADTLYWP